jgi:hypothetical protein
MRRIAEHLFGSYLKSEEREGLRPSRCLGIALRENLDQLQVKRQILARQRVVGIQGYRIA